MFLKERKKIVAVFILLFSFQQIDFAQGFIWNSQVIQRPDSALIYKTKEEGSYELPSWSTDDERILFTLSKGGYRNDYSNLYLMNSKTGDVEAITNERNLRIQSSNGDVYKADKIIYTVNEAMKNKLKAYKIMNDKDGLEYEVLENTSMDKLDNCFNPSLSPGEQWLLYDAPSQVYLRDGSPVQQIYKLNLVTGEYHQLTTGEDHKRRAKWSPDGHVILYEQYDGQFREWSLYTTDLNGKWNRRLTESTGDETYGSFSADSEWIVYSSNRLLNDEEIEKNILIVRNVYNGKAVELTNTDFYDTAPDWSKTSNRIVFESSPKEPKSYNASRIAVIEVTEELLNEAQ